MNEFDPHHIKSVPPVQPRKSQRTKTGSPAPGSRAFHDLLSRNETEKAALPEADATKSSLPEIPESFTARKLKLNLEKHLFGQKLETALQLLEKYAGQVAHPEGRLKQAWETLEQASAHLKATKQEFKTAGLDDNALEQLLRQVDATLQAEQIKFHRGDYT